MDKNAELEREAIAVVKGIPKWAMKPEMRDFLRRLADHFGWNNLKGVL